MTASQPQSATATALARFTAATATWFTEAFEAPTAAQRGAWEAAENDDHALVVAPTGSGKTLAAFLWAIDQIVSTPTPPDAERCRVLYVSPLKALASDVERNLRSPLVGISRTAQRLGLEDPPVRVGLRTGDTPPTERRRLATKPPDILITTPESLFLILTSAARAGLAGVRTVILDEVHVLAGSKRGAHLALSLERLDAMLPRPAQRIGLSATVRPVESVMTFLGGTRPIAHGGRPVTLVQPPTSKELRLDVDLPVPDLTDIEAGTPGTDLSGDAAGATPTPQERSSIWPALTRRILEIITAHRATLIFTNGRRTAERLTAALNEMWATHQASEHDGAAHLPEAGTAWPALTIGASGASLGAEAVLARAHHGSMSREERTRVEEDLKSGRLPAVVATSSLELGIDMGAIDVVVQVGAPPSVASLLQRVGRAGHQVGATSHGIVFPTHRGDLVPCAVTALRARASGIEAVHALANPLDVLAQQIVAMAAMDEWSVTELIEVVRRAAPFATVGEASVDAVLDMLAGRYPSEDFASLRARIVWDRVAGTISGRPGAQQLATTSGGTIPDRGLFGVFLAGGEPGERVASRGGRRVGELDEEMVFESRVGDTFTLGSSTWRIEQITRDQVLVSPAPGLPGRLPFWRGDQPGRPFELGEELGRMIREAATSPSTLRDHLAGWAVGEWTGDNLADYLTQQREATGYLPTDTTIVIERFRDDIGDWRVVIHSPFGSGVHAPWAVVVAARLRERLGSDVGVMHTDDGIVLRIPDVSDPLDAMDASGEGQGLGTAWDPPGRAQPVFSPASADHHLLAGTVALEDLLLDPDAVSGEVIAALGSSAHFAARFREAASRSLLLPRRRPGRRAPLWQQRQRASQLLSVAARYPDFPIVLEAVRECLQDDFDTPALADIMRRVSLKEIRVVEVTTSSPSPFARSMLLAYVGTFLYDGDAPLAERRAAALTLDPSLLAELLGQDASDLADLLDPAALAAVEAEVGLRTNYARASDAEHLIDLLARLGPVTEDEVRARATQPDSVASWLTDLERARRAIRVRIAGVTHWAAIEDAGRLRDGLGVALPVGVPEAFLKPVADPLGDLIRRHARCHGPFTVADLHHRFGLAPGAWGAALTLLVNSAVLTRGRLRPGAQAQAEEFCDTEVLRRIRRRSLAAARAEVEAVPPAALGIFGPRWHQLGQLHGTDGLLSAVEQLAGVSFDPTDLESAILPARIRDYSPALLDALLAAGEVTWIGTGHPRGNQRAGTITLIPSDAVELLAPDPQPPANPLTDRILTILGDGGRFFRDIVTALAAQAQGDPDLAEVSPQQVVDALWEAVWCGLVTNDTLAPVRAAAQAASSPASRRRSSPPPRARRLGRSRLLAPALHAASPSQASPGGNATTRIPTPADAAGRWSLVPQRSRDQALRSSARAASLIERHGLVLRNVAASEDIPGGFAALYPLLARLEDSGALRRGYLVEGQGAAQFALPECVDRLRADAQRKPGSMVLAAADPANPYGSLLPWPAPVNAEREGSGRPRRVAGADVVLVDGQLALFLERGGGTALTFGKDDRVLRRAALALIEVAPTRYRTLVLRRLDGEAALTSEAPLKSALLDAGFIANPQGLRPATPARHA